MLLLSGSVIVIGVRVIIIMFPALSIVFPDKRKFSAGILPWRPLFQDMKSLRAFAHQRMRLSVFFSTAEPIIWNSCTMMTISNTVTSITGVL